MRKTKEGRKKIIPRKKCMKKEERRKGEKHG